MTRKDWLTKCTVVLPIGMRTGASSRSLVNSKQTWFSQDHKLKTCTVHCLSLTFFFILSLYRKRLDFSLSHTFFFILSLYRKKLDFSLSHTFSFYCLFTEKGQILVSQLTHCFLSTVIHPFSWGYSYRPFKTWNK